MPIAADKVLGIGTRYRTSRVAVGTAAFSSGNTSTIDLPRNALQKELILRVSGSLTNANGGGTIVSEAPLSIVRRVELVMDGAKTLWSASGKQLYRLAHHEHGKQPELTAPTNAVATVPFAATILIGNEARRKAHPPDSYLETRNAKRFELRITWGTVTDLTNAAGSTVAAGTQVSVVQHATLDGIRPNFARLLTFIEVPIVASGVLRFELPKQGLLSEILLYADKDTVPDDTLVTDVSLLIDSTVRAIDRVLWADVQRDNVAKYQLDGGATAGAQIPGYAMLDVTEDGLLTSALNTLAVGTIHVECNVVKSGTAPFLRALMVQYEPLVEV